MLILILFQRATIDSIFLYLDIVINMSTIDIILDQFIGWPHSYYTLSLSLFAVSCYAAASTLDSMQEEIKKFHLIEMSPLLAMNRLKKWKRCHASVCDTVDAINHCFGSTLFLAIIYTLIRFITLFVAEFAEGFDLTVSLNRIANFSGFIQFVYWLVLVCAPVDHLRTKVKCL